MPKSPNLLPEFHELLRDAHAACEQQDMFDLDSSNAESKEKWERLGKEAIEAKSRLISFIKENSEALLPQLMKLAGSS